MKKIMIMDVLKLLSKALVLDLIMSGAAYSLDLEPMNDSELEAVSGGDAIQLTLRLRNNVGPDNSPLYQADGETLLCDPATYNLCRLGLQFEGQDNTWLMLKEFYGSLLVEDMRLEGATLDSGGTIYRDLSRFQGSDGGCLIDSCNPDGLAAIQVTYPFGKNPGEYSDLKTFLNIGRLAVEYDDGSTPGYLQNQNAGSAFAYRISDSETPNGYMQMHFQGRAMIYGF